MPDRPPETEFSDSLWEEYSDVDVADIVVDSDAPDLQPTYTYRIPEEIQNTLQPGDCVHVPFSGQELIGYVMERRKLPRTDPLFRLLKPIRAIVADAVTINAEQLHLVRWMSERYVCDLLPAIRCVAPQILGATIERFVRLADPEARGADCGSSVPQAHLIEMLRALGGKSTVKALRDLANLPTFQAAYGALIKKAMLVETRRVARPKAVAKTVPVYSLGAAAGTLGSVGGAAKLSSKQRSILDVLVSEATAVRGPIPAPDLLELAQSSASSLKGLVDKGLVTVGETTVLRAATESARRRTSAPTLTPGQEAAVTAIREGIDVGSAATYLLFGVTASGKTEVYLNVISAALAAGRNAMVLVPEIALTGQVVDIFVGRFGDQVAVLHSKLSEGERHDEWRRLQDGAARIVVGARSAIFAPLTNIGLIVVDEEHETSYKQENTPRYNAKELARERARRSGATLVLGSATPSLETYYACESRSLPAITRIEMPERIDSRPLPAVEVVDLREEFREKRVLFSTRLVEALTKRLDAGQQSILFLNRRGYAQFVLCRDCGWTAKCPNCAVSLAYHTYENILKCHHCGHQERVPNTCPECKGTQVKAFGIGTEKVEAEVLRLLPSARVARMDRDTTARKGEHARLVRKFREGDADILIGTQMIAKGLDFPNVTLVGVVSADTAINMPDFRAAERTFQLLTQVAGRAGRGTTPGEVIIQTFSPGHYAVQAAIRHDYQDFYRQEIVFREELRYPPFSRFANIVSLDEIEKVAADRALVLARALRIAAPDDVEIIGPAPAPIARLKGLYRYHVPMRGPVTAQLAWIVRTALERIPPSDRRGLQIDMDPLTMI